MGKVMKRSICFDNLPKVKNTEKSINWRESIGKSVAFEYDGITGVIDIIEYDTNRQRLKVKYLDNDICEMATSGLLKVSLGYLIGAMNTTHIYNVGDIINKLRITNQIQPYRTTEREYECECTECGFNSDMRYYKNGELQNKRWRITEGDLKRGNSCPCCSKYSKIVVTDINSMWKKNNYMIKKYGIDEQFAKMNTSVSTRYAPVTCPDCGRIFNRKCCDIYSRETISCKCRDGISRPEKFMMNILDQLKINYIYQFGKLNEFWCKSYKYDFLIDSNVIIETHGEQHYNDSGWGKAKDIQSNDYNKMELALSNGIEIDKYVVIDCKDVKLDYMKSNIMNSSLVELYDLSIVDWDKAWEYSFTNLSKEVCDKWNLYNGSKTSAEIAEEFQIDKSTVIDWLKQWAEIGGCKYNAKEERLKVITRTGINGKPIEIFKDNISLGEFVSSAELARRSLELFGVQLNSKNIASVLSIKSKTKTHKGYTFKYVN